MRVDRSASSSLPERRGAILVLAAFVMIVVFAFVAFTIDTGYMAIVGQELQAAADAAAMGAIVELEDGEPAVRRAATEIADANAAGGVKIALAETDVELGTFDFAAKTFDPATDSPNAIRVRARATDRPLFFAPVIGHDAFDMQREAIAMLNPRDIVFVVDLSGSMNDDTEPCWATGVIDGQFGATYPNVASNLMQDVYDDFGYGPFPGTIEYIGAPLPGVPQSNKAYAEMTDDFGPLTAASIPAVYRIDPNDSEWTRRTKAYKWMIDEQIVRVMPNALPTPDSATNYGYWEKYLDYIIDSEAVGSNPPPPPPSNPPPSNPPPSNPPPSNPPPSSPPPPTPPTGSLDAIERFGFDRIAWRIDQPRVLGELASASSNSIVEILAAATLGQSYGPGLPRRGSTLRVTLPPGQDGDRIDDFNNPNKTTFPGTSSNLPRSWRGKIGYATYVQFMMDWGRDRSPQQSNGGNAAPGPGKTPLSMQSADCPLHTESTAGGDFDFPPREQPMHATRRSLIAAIKVVKDMNQHVTASGADRVAIVTFDGRSAYHTPQVVLPLTSNYTQAMQTCTTLQATSDIGRTTATESGLILAREHLRPAGEGGAGRSYTSKVVILLTDGVPNEWESTPEEIDDYVTANPSGDFYGGGYTWLDAALVQGSRIQGDDSRLFAVGMGLGADYGFLDRLARFANTDEGGQSPRGSGNPAEYEARLTEIFTEIIKSPGSRLVK